jgi:D-3-phosphoglycerate dehydrogenase
VSDGAQEWSTAIASVAVLDTRYPDLAVEAAVLEPAGIDLIRRDGADPEDVRAVADVDVIIVGSRARFDEPTLGELSCRAIIRAGIGVDSVDLDAAARRGILVCNVPDYGTESVAQHALAMALAGTRRLLETDAIVRRGAWGFPAQRPMHLPSTSVAGVLGQGRIGRRVAELFAAVGFGRVIGHDPYVAGDDIERVEFETLLAEVDVLSLHVPGGAEPVIGAAELARMKPGSVIVNTARGALIDEAALAEALAAGRPRVAALDVFSVEPPDLSVFEGVTDRLILSPHQAWYTEESQEDLRRKCAEEALRILRGEAPRSPVNEPKERT